MQVQKLPAGLQSVWPPHISVGGFWAHSPGGSTANAPLLPTTTAAPVNPSNRNASRRVIPTAMDLDRSSNHFPIRPPVRNESWLRSIHIRSQSDLASLCLECGH